MKKFLLFMCVVLATGNVHGALTLKAACNETLYYFNGALLDGGAYILYDGTCPTDYIKVTGATSMMQTPTLIGYMYAPSNVDISDSTGTFRYSSPTPTDTSPSNVCVYQ